MAGGVTPLSVSPALMLTVAGDHGVTAQGVSPMPQAVTRQMTRNFLNGGAGVNVLCRSSGMDLRVVDAGCAGGPTSRTSCSSTAAWATAPPTSARARP